MIDGKMCGTFGDISILVFANKIITSGEGAGCNNSKELDQKCRYYKNLCFKIDGIARFSTCKYWIQLPIIKHTCSHIMCPVRKIDYY